MAETDRIRKTTILRAPQDRVWRAISDTREFGTWFGMAIDGAFADGARLDARIVPTTVDAAVAKTQQPYAGTLLVLFVERVEPMHLLAFRWHPEMVEPGTEATAPTTLVTFELEPVEGGTRLTITESGFDAVPLERRAQALANNDEGWTAQLTLVAKYLAQAA